MFTLFWSAKGGAGTTVVAAGAAVSRRQPTLLVDLAGDLPLVLGLDDPDRPGVHDWLGANASVQRLANLEVPVTEHASLITAGPPAAAPAERWQQLAAHLAADPRHVVVDAGAHAPPAELTRAADQILLVTRNCYVALRAFQRRPGPATGAVVVEEPGRAIGDDDVARALGVPVVATVLVDPAVARAVDAGLLAGRVPAALRRAWARAAA